MLKFVILLSAIGCALGAAVPKGMLPLLDGRIVGGSNADINSFPWQISLQRSGGHSCGGSIYSSTIIVTAAHCLQDVSASVLSVRAGANYWFYGGVVRAVASFQIHENYNPYSMVNDIAIVRLASPLSYGCTIQRIPLASVAPADGTPAVVSGWGTLYSGAEGIPNHLQSVNVNIVSLAVCGSSAWGYGSAVEPTMICAAAPDKDACQGDSGGPLVSGGLLVGVVSWGYGCAHPDYPGVYADVAALRSWVINNSY